MASGYIGVPVVSDPAALVADYLDYLAAAAPGFTPREGHLEVWMGEAIARMVAEARDVFSRVPPAIFAYFGKTLLGLPPIASAPASMPTTWVVNDALGYTIPAGTAVGWAATGSLTIPFRTVAQVVIPPGSTTTAAGAVLVTAITAGVVANGLGPGPMKLLDSLAFVASVTATAASSGGVDLEGEYAYLSRLSEELLAAAPRPIVPSDFEVLARRVIGVARAKCIDGYNPSDLSYNNQRMVTVVGVDADGAALSPTVKATLTAYLASMREVNFVIHVGDPTFTAVAVNFHAALSAGADPVATLANAQAALASYLDPGTFAGGTDVPAHWTAQTTVYLYETARVLDQIVGIDHVTLLTLNGVSADLVLPGIAPLPTAGAITGTLT